MYRFLWMGKLEKLKLDEIKNPCSAGGLNLPCVISKADSLFLSQVRGGLGQGVDASAVSHAGAQGQGDTVHDTQQHHP